jgi:hypothetical protein
MEVRDCRRGRLTSLVSACRHPVGVKAPRNAYRQLSDGERFGSEILHRQVKTSPASVAGLAGLVNFRDSFHRYRRFSEQSGIIGRHT